MQPYYNYNPSIIGYWTSFQFFSIMNYTTIYIFALRDFFPTFGIISFIYNLRNSITMQNIWTFLMSMIKCDNFISKVLYN